ncbi:hypothetical protein [Streptomyces rugosispiralis]|uniref:Uncharacterized protein n=1 Tax=Streptomyces rugosispiralis TaxID=2967341 RepID=A0ABT1URX9_9ACTN|nr:hypothetical protein [Streptomyces rugosispiralis]MCQ8187870.1 hypothetical protein [Streptomyces rugosispiralis]
MDLDLNLTVGPGGCVDCRHCGAQVGTSTAAPLDKAVRTQRPPSEAGPGMHADPARFTDRPIVLRQVFCPNCLVLLHTEIVPADEPCYRQWSLR